MRSIFSIAILVSLIVIPGANCFGAEHHVTSIAQANNIGNPGDTVFIKAGVYNTTLKPLKSGTSGKAITYKAEGGKVTLSNVNGPAVDLKSRSYITVDGLTILNSKGPWVDMSSGPSSYNTIRNCIMQGNKSWSGINIQSQGHHNRIINNTLESDCPCSAVCEGQGGPDDLIYIINSGHNLIQGNNFYGGIHDAIDIQDSGNSGATSYNIIRNNHIENTLHSNIDVWGVEYILIENNTMVDAGTERQTNYCGSEKDRTMERRGHKGIFINTQYGIIRNNISANNGMGITTESAATSDTKHPWKCNSYRNRIYNNTLAFNNVGIYHNSIDPVLENVIKNNIIYNSEQFIVYMYDGNGVGSKSNFDCNNLFGSANATVRYAAGDKRTGEISVNPGFIKANNGKTDDYKLKSGSPMINAGTWLTVTQSEGSGKIITVKDARYFMNGWGLIQGDTIQFNGNTSQYRVTAVDYAKNTITVNQDLKWSKGQGISLPYRGNRPDMGAFEYIQK